MFDAAPGREAQASPKYREWPRPAGAVSAPALWQILETVEQLRRDVAALFEPST